MPKVLIVEDEEPLSLLLRYNLEAEGYQVDTCIRGDEAEIRLRESLPDLLLLDWMLPGLSGIELCRRLRAREDSERLPVIMLTARGEEFDRVQGFEYGADDYVVKPFSMSELLLRIRALLARSEGGAPGVDGVGDRVRFGDTEVDFSAFSVTCDGRQAGLSRRELELLRYFLRFEGATLDRYRLLSDVWGPDDDPTTRTVDQHVLKLRKKIEPDPTAPRRSNSRWRLDTCHPACARCAESFSARATERCWPPVQPKATVR